MDINNNSNYIVNLNKWSMLNSYYYDKWFDNEWWLKRDWVQHAHALPFMACTYTLLIE